jgi:hypothetical protein
MFEIGLGNAQDSVGGTHSSRFLEERTAEKMEICSARLAQMVYAKGLITY